MRLRYFTDSRGREWCVVDVCGEERAVCLDRPTRREERIPYINAARRDVDPVLVTWMGVLPVVLTRTRFHEHWEDVYDDDAWFPRRVRRLTPEEYEVHAFRVMRCGGTLPTVDRCWTAWRGVVFRGGQRRVYPRVPWIHRDDD